MLHLYTLLGSPSKFKKIPNHIQFNSKRIIVLNLELYGNVLIKVYIHY